MKKLIFISLGLAVLINAGSCKKKDKYDNSAAPKNNAIVENAFDEMTNMSDQAIQGDLVFYKSGKVTVTYDKYEAANIEKTPCSVVITIDTVGTIDSLTIDWGTSNCDCNDGKTRRGKIITTFTGSYFNQGTVITHTPINYYVNDNKVEGTKTVTNMGLNSSNQPYYNININGVVTLSSGEIITYTSQRVRTFTAGFSTPLFFWDDEYAITGTASASVVNGDGYYAETITPIHIKVGCGYITQGVLDIIPTGKPVRRIDYGGGTCDATFTITINGNTYTIN
jgi:hypothetical protein